MNCHSCDSDNVSTFYELEQVPVHSVLLMPTKEKALQCAKGDIRLCLCMDCGFIGNSAFDEQIMEYSEDYNPTQAHSPTFNEFHQKLAQQLIENYDIRSKKVLEIGCGEGEFLELLCELGDNNGIGYDPACKKDSTDKISFVKDFYTKECRDDSDFVVCKMTLEHIVDVGEFVSMVKESVKDDAIVYFQVPEVMRILGDNAFWDIYYEHCSYFSEGSLARLFNNSGFEVLNTWKDFDDQYVMITARKGEGGKVPDDLEDLIQNVALFNRQNHAYINEWKNKFSDGKKTVIWGGGSKGVSFLTAVKRSIDYAVDIDPLKHGTYIAGSGEQIVAPDFLKDYKPDRVVIMNPVYQDEIQQDLNKMGLNPEVLTV